jgi:hypothetical protein
MAPVNHDSSPFAKLRIACVNEPGENRKVLKSGFNEYPYIKLYTAEPWQE